VLNCAHSLKIALFSVPILAAEGRRAQRAAEENERKQQQLLLEKEAAELAAAAAAGKATDGKKVRV